MKKTLLLIVVVLAVLVYAASSLVSRDNPESSSSELVPPSTSPTTPSVSASSDTELDQTDVEADLAVPQFKVNSGTEALDMLAALGIDNVEFQQQLTAWGVKHGLSIGWQMRVEDFLDQPYEQYDDQTLKGLADGGSMWAQQILGSRYFNQRPAEAQELFRQAAARGSLQAAASLANLYRAVAQRSEASLNLDPKTLEQIYSLNDSTNSPEMMSYAWSVVEEKMWRAPVTPRVSLANTQIAEACALADALFQDIQTLREQQNLETLSVANPPLFLPNLLGRTGSGCYDQSTARDLSDCRAAEIYSESNSDSQAIWFCVE